MRNPRTYWLPYAPTLFPPALFDADLDSITALDAIPASLLPDTDTMMAWYKFYGYFVTTLHKKTLWKHGLSVDLGLGEASNVLYHDHLIRLFHGASKREALVEFGIEL